MKSRYVRSIILLLLVLALSITPTSSQSIDNPAFYQKPRVYNTSGPIDDATGNDTIAISQDFQSILYTNHDQPLTPWGILVDYSTSCNSSNTTVEQLRALNHDNLEFYSSIRSIPIVGLVERGGGCNWSEKVYMARSLSSVIHLNLTTIVISDNEMVPSADYRPYSVSNISQKFVYTNPLPDNRNASKMQDNDLHATFDTITPPAAVYFVPKSYGDSLRNLLANGTTVNNDEHSVLRLSLVFTPELWLQYSQGEGDNVFTRGYLSYVIALSVILFVAICAGFVFLRWWRIRERRAAREYEAQLSAHAANMQMRRKSKPLPVNIVNAIPIAHYSESTVKNASCVICLEDYQEGETEVRILGCGHGFCVLCIDPWLTQKSTLCPICKWDCLPEDMRKTSTDSTSEIDMGDHSNTAAAAASSTTIIENTPQSSTSLASRQPSPSSQPVTQQSEEKNAAPLQEDTNNGERSDDNTNGNSTVHGDKNNETTLEDNVPITTATSSMTAHDGKNKEITLENDDTIITTTTSNTTCEEHTAPSSGNSIPKSQQNDTKDVAEKLNTSVDGKADHPDNNMDDLLSTSVTSAQVEQEDENVNHETTHVDTNQSVPMAEDHKDIKEDNPHGK